MPRNVKALGLEELVTFVNPRFPRCICASSGATASQAAAGSSAAPRQRLTGAFAEAGAPDLCTLIALIAWGVLYEESPEMACRSLARCLRCGFPTSVPLHAFRPCSYSWGVKPSAGFGGAAIGSKGTWCLAHAAARESNAMLWQGLADPLQIAERCHRFQHSQSCRDHNDHRASNSSCGLKTPVGSHAFLWLTYDTAIAVSGTVSQS